MAELRDEHGTPIAILLYDAAQAVQRAVEVALQREGATEEVGPASARLLMLVAIQPGITPGEIAVQLLQETHSISGLLNRLEEKEYVERTRDRKDRRVVHVTISKKGAKAAIAAERIWGQLSLLVHRHFAATGLDPLLGLTRIREGALAEAIRTVGGSQRKLAGRRTS